MNASNHKLISVVNSFTQAVLGGMAIGIAGAAYLSCENQYIGAALFCFGLCSILLFKWKLFTGAAGYADSYFDLCCSLPAIAIGNFLGTHLIALFVAVASPGVLQAAEAIASAKLLKSFPQLISSGWLCGAIMYIAVDAWNSRGSFLGALLGVPLFILCGFEHSIADMFYFALAESLTISGNGLLLILVVLVSNLIGAQSVKLWRDAYIVQKV